MACLNGGVFTRAQWTSFLGCHPEKVRRAVLALVAQGLAVEEAPAAGIHGIGRMCRIRARKVYRALGSEEFFRSRRITSNDVLMRRLLALDYVLDCPRLPWLPTEAEKVAAFEALGIERRVLPQRTYRGAAGNIRRHFHLGLPLALGAERAVFVYVDPGNETATSLRAWGAAHRKLWWVLRDRGYKIEVVAVARGWKETSRADTVLGNWARDPSPSKYDAEIARKIEWIEHVLRSGDKNLIREVCGDIRGRARAAGGTQESGSPTVRSGAVAPGERMADGAARADGVLMEIRPSRCRTGHVFLASRSTGHGIHPRMSHAVDTASLWRPVG